MIVATGAQAEFGRIAQGLGERPPETEFQIGLRNFSMLLVTVAGVLTAAIFVVNVSLHKPSWRSARRQAATRWTLHHWDSPAASAQATALPHWHRIAMLPFDHDRRLVSVLGEDDRGNRLIITKGAPEGVLARCTDVPAAARAALDVEFAAGNRVIA